MLKKKILSGLLAATLAVSAVCLTACGGDKSTDETTAAPSAENAETEETAAEVKDLGSTLTVYTAMPEDEIPYYFNAFEKDTGVEVQYVRLSAGEMLTRVEAEKENPNASMMFGGSSDTYIAANGSGLLEPYQTPELVNVPDQYHDDEEVWNPIYVGAICFACNSEWFEEQGLDYPKTWDDLLKPEFEGQVSLAHPSTSGTSYTILSTLVQAKGEDEAYEYLKKLDNNVRQYTKAGAAPPMEVGLGEAAIAITFSHDGLKPVAEGYPVEVVFPEDGTGYEVGAAALIKNGPAEEVEAAKAFIDWLNSVRGQECYIESKSNRLPVNSNAKVTDGLQSLSDLNVIDYDAVWAGENRTRLIEHFNEYVDNAEDLKQ
ncbi:MAG TPA: ABC transporter substrate-binding protein [Clostridiaceae bacterium]|nr:ABC transporter substrate-binding protein [Clostridiaceae bacterium]